MSFVRSPSFVVLRLISCAGALTLGLAACGCNVNEKKAPEKKAPEVDVTTPIRDTVADFQDFTGRLDALKSVDIRARVSGFVLSAPFVEGEIVYEGKLLFQIDPLTYNADLGLAAANLKLAKADQNLQEKNAIRAKALIGGRAMAQEDYDTTVASAEKARSSVEAMAAMRDRAQLYVDYTKVIAPMAGRISRRLVDPGNLVNADTTILTTIVSDSQLYAYFDVDERTYLDLVGAVSPGKDELLAKLQFPVLLRLANEEQFTRTGVVNFVDNRVTASSGTIRMRAVFDNPGGLLRAGLFVRIRLPIGASYSALLIPDEAILNDQGRKYVYLVDDKKEVVYRTVEIGQEIKGLRVIKKGINEGDQVVISGMQRVRAGLAVNPTKKDPPAAPESPLGKLLEKKETAKPATK